MPCIYFHVYISTGSTQVAHPSQALRNWRKQSTRDEAEAPIAPSEAHLCGGFGGGGVGEGAGGGSGEGWQSHPQALTPEQEELPRENYGRIFPKKVIKYILRPVMKTRKSST